MKIVIAVLFLIACSLPAMSQDQLTQPHPVTDTFAYPPPFPMFPEVRTQCPISLPLPVASTALESAQQEFIARAMASPDFDSRQFYSCAWVGCGATAVVSWLFGGPPAFAAGCTGTMLVCAARSAGLGQDQIPPELIK